jgi:hypothetical protein
LKPPPTPPKEGSGLAHWIKLEKEWEGFGMRLPMGVFTNYF